MKPNLVSTLRFFYRALSLSLYAGGALTEQLSISPNYAQAAYNFSLVTSTKRFLVNKFVSFVYFEYYSLN